MAQGENSLGLSASLHPDVNSWLLTFGFQLYNVIPGYPKPDMDAMEPSYELIHTQMKTQEWDNSKVTLPFGAAVTTPRGRSNLIGSPSLLSGKPGLPFKSVTCPLHLLEQT